MLIKVTEQNFKEFLEGRLMVATSAGENFGIYRFLCSSPTECEGNEGKFIVVQNVSTLLPERWYVPNVIKFNFFFDSYDDVLALRIEKLKEQINMFKDQMSNKQVDSDETSKYVIENFGEDLTSITVDLTKEQAALLKNIADSLNKNDIPILTVTKIDKKKK